MLGLHANHHKRPDRLKTGESFFFSFFPSLLQPSLLETLLVIATLVNRSRGIGIEDGSQRGGGGFAKLLLCCPFVIETTTKTSNDLFSSKGLNSDRLID